MKLSLDSLKVLTEKYGKGLPFGFEDVLSTEKGSLSKDKARQLFEELIRSEMISFDEEHVRISDFGQYILNIMIHPDIFIRIENKALKTDIRIYLHDVYYLSMLREDKGDKTDICFEADLFSDIKTVVGAFTYALYDPEAESTSERNNHFDITIASWEDGENVTDDIHISGYYVDDMVCFEKHIPEQVPYDSKTECELSELINTITRWMLNKLAVIISKQER